MGWRWRRRRWRLLSSNCWRHARGGDSCSRWTRWATVRGHGWKWCCCGSLGGSDRKRASATRRRVEDVLQIFHMGNRFSTATGQWLQRIHVQWQWAGIRTMSTIELYPLGVTANGNWFVRKQFCIYKVMWIACLKCIKSINVFEVNLNLAVIETISFIYEETLFHEHEHKWT